MGTPSYGIIGLAAWGMRGITEMALQRTVNVRFFCVLAASLLVLGIGVAFLHGYQVQRNAKVIKDRAQQAEDSGQFDQAAR